MKIPGPSSDSLPNNSNDRISRGKRDSRDDLPKFPNIGYLGSSYNIFKGNPLSTKGLDPGFTFRNPVRFTYDEGTTTPDGRYLIPDHTQVLQAGACSFQFSSESIQDTYSYRESLRVEVTAEFGGFGASFSTSTDFKEVYESTGSEGTRFMSSAVRCEVYHASLLSTAALSDEFREDVRRLPVDADPDTTKRYVHNFLNSWGTHYAQRLRMGGRYGIRSSFSSSNFSELHSSGVDVTTAAGYSGKRSLNNEVVVGEEREAALKFESQREDFQIYQIGGKPPLGSDDNSQDWASTVSSNPIPLSYDLLETKDLLTSEYFPDDEEIDYKREVLFSDEEMGRYCTSLEVPYDSLCYNLLYTNETLEVEVNPSYKEVQCKRGEDEDHYFQETALNDYIFGTLGYFQRSGTAASIIQARIIDWDSTTIVKLPTHWELTSIGSASFGVLRPVCPTGYSSVSDYLCCDPSNAQACLLTVRSVAPCIKDECLTQCTFGSFYTADGDYPNDLVYYPIIYGNSNHGNTYYDNGPHFIRAIELDSSGWQQDRSLAKCLDFSCLKYR